MTKRESTKRFVTLVAVIMIVVACESEAGSSTTTSDEAPTSSSEPSRMLLEIALEQPELSMFGEVVMQHGLDLDLSECCERQSIVLAPNDDAFESFLSEQGMSLQEFLDQDPEGTYELFGGHILTRVHEDSPGEYDLPSLLAGPVTLGVGEDSAITLTAHPHIEVIDRIEARNGRVYVIDGLLIDSERNPGSSEDNSTSAEGVSPQSFIEGEVELGQFPTQVSFTTSDSWFVPVAQPGAVILEDLDRESDFTRAVLILSATPFEAETVNGWADRHDDVSILQQDETQVGGFETTVYDLTYDGPGEVPFLTAQCCGGRIILRSTEYYRIWVIDINDENPLVLFSPVLRGDAGWFDKARALIDTMQFGEK